MSTSASLDRAADEAAEWFVASRTGELTKDEHERFMQWLGDSAANVREYLAIAELWGSLPATPGVASASAEDLQAALKTKTAISVMSASSSSSSPSRLEGRLWKRSAWLKAAAAACVLGAIAWLTLPRLDPNEFITRRGEQRSLELPDGSVLQLNAMSHIIVAFDEDRRRIELHEGEALFRVAKDSTRPFEVATADAVVRAVGTTFNVYRRGPDTRVAVVEGKVQVLGQAASVALAANETARVGSSGRVVRAPPVEAQKVIAWTQRRLIFDEEPLERVVDEFNLYNVEQLALEDEDLAQFHINGVFDADDPQALVAYLERVWGVEVERKNNGIRLQRSQTH